MTVPPRSGAPGPADARTGTWWLHPLLVAAFPVLFLFAQNLREQLSLEPLWLPLAAVIGAGAATLVATVAVGRLLGASPARSALVASLVIFLALTYGHAWTAFGELIRLHRYLLAGWAVLLIAGTVVIARLPGSAVQGVTRAVTVAAGILVVINVVPLGELAVRAFSGDGGDVAEGPEEAGEATAGRDVW